MLHCGMQFFVCRIVPSASTYKHWCQHRNNRAAIMQRCSMLNSCSVHMAMHGQLFEAPAKLLYARNLTQRQSPGHTLHQSLLHLFCILQRSALPFPVQISNMGGQL